MTRWAISGSGTALQRWSYVPFALGAALLIGLAVPVQPALAFAAVVGLTVFLSAVLYPDQTSYLLLVASVVSVQYLFTLTMMGVDLQSFYKLGVLFLSIPAMVRYGVYRDQAMPVAALLGLVLITYMFSDRHPLLTASAPVLAFIGLAAPFVFLLIRWPKRVAEKHILIVCLMPAISVVFGVLFQAAGLTQLFVVEFNGAARLQGANIPAHLAFLAFIAFLVSLMEVKRNAEKMMLYYALMGVNMLILLLTGTRGPLIAAMAMILVFVYDLTRQFLRGKTALLVPLFGFFTVLTASVYLQLDNFKKRSFERTTDTGVDLSGRSEAWEFFLNGVKDSPWFGRGLGSVLVSNDGSIYEGFVVPHNEYIRFYYDGGIVGAVLLFGALLYVFRKSYSRIAPELRMYYGAFIFGMLVYSISDNTLSTVQFTVPFCAFLNALSNVSNHSTRKEGLSWPR